MKRLYFLLSIFVLSGVIFTACGDDEPTQPTQDERNFLPLQVGNSWKYETNNIDTTGNEIEPEFSDSSAVTGTENKDGQQAYVMTHFRLGNQGWFERSKQHYYKANNITYTHSDFFSTFEYQDQTIDLGLSGQWLQFVRKDQTQWNLLSNVPIDTVTIPLSGGTVSLYGSINVGANNLGTESVIANNQQYDATKIKYTATVNANIVGLPGIPVSITIINTYWFVDGIGIVKKRLDPGQLSSAVYNLKFPGEVSILTKASVFAGVQ